jgi:hypothetical protein
VFLVIANPNLLKFNEWQSCNHEHTAVEEHCTPKGKIVQLNESVIRDHLGEMVRSTVEDTLNRMLDAEADRLMSDKNGKFNRSIL